MPKKSKPEAAQAPANTRLFKISTRTVTASLDTTRIVEVSGRHVIEAIEVSGFDVNSITEIKDVTP